MALDDFTGGPSSAPVDWTTNGAWSTDAPPGAGDVVQDSGYGIMDITNSGAGGGPGVETLGGLTLTDGANLSVEALLAVDGGALGEAGSTIDIYGGDGGGVSAYSGVTGAMGSVSIFSVPIPTAGGSGPYQGSYTYDGSGNTQTVSVGANESAFFLNGSGNSPIVTLAPGGYASGGHFFAGGVNNTPTVNLGGGFMTITANNGGTINLSGGGQVMLGAGVVYSGVLTDLGASQALDVAEGGSLNASGHSINLTANTVTLDFSASGTTEAYTLQFNPLTTPVSSLNFTTSTGAWTDGSFFVITSGRAVCFCSGARIRTARGEVAVEDLTVGDLAVTSDGKARPIVWIGHRRIERPRPEQWPVRVMAGAFGEGRPIRDLFLSPGHAVCVNVVDEVFVPVGELINGATIAQVEVSQVTYWHVELESHDVLLAEGLGCESYMEAGNRAFFGKGYGRLDDIDPALIEESLSRYARPLVTDAATTAALRRRLTARAERLGWTQTADMDLHLVVDGRRVDPVLEGDMACFAFPAQAKAARLASRTFSPAWTGESQVGRELGVMVRTLRLADGSDVSLEVTLDDLNGFHPEEAADGASWRWTDGRLDLPAELWADCRGLVVLRLGFDPAADRVWMAPERETHRAVA